MVLKHYFCLMLASRQGCSFLFNNSYYYCTTITFFLNVLLVVDVLIGPAIRTLFPLRKVWTISSFHLPSRHEYCHNRSHSYSDLFLKRTVLKIENNLFNPAFAEIRTADLQSGSQRWSPLDHATCPSP